VPEGRIDVIIGTQPSGQGHETSFSQVVADLLGVAPEKVKIILGDTDVVQVGGGSHSGRSMRHAATVFSKAAVALIDQGKRLAADITRYASVDDVGRCINPLIVHGQTHGAIAQGIGQAMWERCVVDPASGQPLAGSLMDYGLPRSNTLPSFTVEIAEVLSPTN